MEVLKEAQRVGGIVMVLSMVKHRLTLERNNVTNDQMRLFLHLKSLRIKCKECDVFKSTKATRKRHIQECHEKILCFACPKSPDKASQSICVHRHIKCIHSEIRDNNCPHSYFKFSEKN